MTISRRIYLQLIALQSSLLGLFRGSTLAQTNVVPPKEYSPRWSMLPDRIWLSEDCWANPMEDWRIANGAAECTSNGGNRNIHSLTHTIADPKKEFSMSVLVDAVDSKLGDKGVGFRIGIQTDIQDYRANCFSSSGIEAGYVDGKLRLGPTSKKIPVAGPLQSLVLELQGTPSNGAYQLTLIATTQTGRELGQVSHAVDGEEILGNVALVNNFSPANNKGTDGCRYRFREWKLAGAAFYVAPERAFGPILWTMYTLSDSRSSEGFVLKLTALTGPLGVDDDRRIELQVAEAGTWKSLGFADLDPDAWTATFRIPNWNEKAEAPFRAVYRQKFKNGSQLEFFHQGTIKANPSGRPLRIAAMTCQNDYAFPYAPVAENIVKLNPDLLYFSGDQIYENHGGYGIIRNPADRAILNYLRKFYQFGWAFREAMRSSPTVCIPDDHDVFHGNLWGEGGKAATEGDSSSSGGYLEPARMVNVVHKTNASHHPDYYDPKPVLQEISVYYGDMVYGNVGFAIIADRQFKSGPMSVDTKGPRPDHVADPNFDVAKLDVPGLILLGERQEKFLEAWVEDWRGHSMKILLSQTVFSGLATHHGKFDGYLKADLDCGGWPQTPRNRALRILRKGKVLHINGDQHLTSLSQYGVDKQRDSGWSFCTPAIAVGYPRWWRQDELGVAATNRPKHGLTDTGEYLDGLGNKTYVYAIGNPEKASKKHRYELAHQKASGFGFVTVDTEKKTYFIESYRFSIDATDGNPDNQFPGWPVTIHQRENSGDNVLG